VKNTFLITFLLVTMLLSACGHADSAASSAAATNTLPPIPTNTPQATATIAPTETPFDAS